MRRIPLSLFLLATLAPVAARADLPQLKGWPQTMGTYQAGIYVLAPRDGVALADLDGDKKLDVIASSGDKVYAWSAAGKALAGWPVTLKGTAQAPPAVGDIDGDGDLEVVQVCRSLKYSETSWVYVLHHDGKVAKGWPMVFSTMVFLPVNLADLDGDGAQDLLVPVSRWPPGGTLRAFSGDGRQLGGTWSHDLGDLPMAPPSVGPVGSAGKLTVLHATRDKLTLRDADGAAASGFPVSAPSGYRFSGSVLLLDMDSVGPGSDAVAVITDTASKGEAKVLIYATQGKAGVLTKTISLATSGVVGVVGPVSGDMDGDGTRELVVGLRGLGFFIVDRAGKVSGPIKPLKDIQAAPVLVDLDGDGDLELLCENNTSEQSTGKGYLEAYHSDGKVVAGFPLRPTGGTMVNNASVADLDGDGKLELALVTTTLSAPYSAWVNLYPLDKAKAAAGSWPSYGANARRSFCAGCASASTTKWKADGWVPDLGSPDLAGAPEAGVGEAGAAEAGATDAGGGDAGTSGGEEDDGCTVARAPGQDLPAGLLLLTVLMLVYRRRFRK